MWAQGLENLKNLLMIFFLNAGAVIANGNVAEIVMIGCRRYDNFALREAKAEPCLRKIPVVVLTTSEEERDRAESFNLGVAGYMLKPVDYNQFIDVVRIIDLYWTLSKLAPWSAHDK